MLQIYYLVNYYLMGRPLTNSIDQYVTYPIVYNQIGYFKNIHPIQITLFCIVMKYLSLVCLWVKSPYCLTVTLTLERLLDCLDGEVARYYNKCTKLGHYLDKYSDVVFRCFMCYECFIICSQAAVYNFSWFILMLLTVTCPGVYLYEYSIGKIDTKLIVPQQSYAIIIEDNATIICFLLPLLISFIPV